MTTYYVATDGSNSADGSSGSPWKTISHAMAQSTLKPGDTVMVRPGTYNEPYGISMKAGSAAGDITLKSEVPHEAHIRTDAFAAIYMANYTTVEGFDIQADGHGIFNKSLHHITMRDNVVHDCGNSGMGAMWSDFVTIEGNEIYNCASKTWDSGISIYEPRNITGDTTTEGYRIIIRNNISHDNVQDGQPYTDGNGIIMDDFHNSQMAGAPNYTFPSLVEGNIVYNNGGKGIAVHWSDNVTVRNNTAYHNNQDNKNPATYKGELSQWQSENNLWVNNIAVADTEVNSTNQAISIGGGSSGTTFLNNLTFNGTPGRNSVHVESGSTISILPEKNLFGRDPQFVDPADGDFHLESGSPAIDTGSSAYGLGALDADGNPRVVGSIDIGAYEQGTSGGVNHAPVANPDTGFATTADTAITISRSALLNNDTDQDGDPLNLTGVSAANHGTVRIDGTNVVFTPETGYTGPAGFTYSISDGKGGTGSATVSLSVDADSVNAPPRFTSGTTFTIDENSRTVGRVTAIDAEGDALTFAKMGGADAALFNIDSRTGAITFVSAPDYENPADADRDNVYQLTVSVTDGKHPAVATTLGVTVQDVVDTLPPPTSGSSFFAPSARPAGTETRDTADYELGMKFRALKDGDVTALKYYRGVADANDNDTRTLHLWNSSGKELAEVTVTSAPGAVGWQTAVLSTPVHLAADSQYVVSYGTTQNYADTVNYFSGATRTNSDGTLAVTGAAGIYSEKTGSGTGPGYFPTKTWNASNYWADVVFKPSAESSGSAPAPAPLTLSGTSHDDVLLGGDGADWINGRMGDDRLQGNGGADDLFGGRGVDTFVYAAVSDSTPEAPDVIHNFVRGIEKIDLSAIDAVAGGGDDAFTWIADSAFSGVAGQLRSQSTPTGLVLEGDIDGDSTADLAIILEAGFHTLAAGDILY